MPKTIKVFSAEKGLNLERELMSVCSKIKQMGITGDVNALSAALIGYIQTDNFVSELFDFFYGTLSFYNNERINPSIALSLT